MAQLRDELRTCAEQALARALLSILQSFSELRDAVYEGEGAFWRWWGGGHCGKSCRQECRYLHATTQEQIKRPKE